MLKLFLCVFLWFWENVVHKQVDWKWPHLKRLSQSMCDRLGDNHTQYFIQCMWRPLQNNKQVSSLITYMDIKSNQNEK